MRHTVLRYGAAALCVLGAVYFLLPLSMGVLHIGMLYPAAGLLLAAVWLVFPGLFRRLPRWLRRTVCAVLVAVLLVLAAGLPLWLWGSFAPLAAAAGYGLAVWYGYRNLDGMSGDISGFALTLGELCGCAAAILWR